MRPIVQMTAERLTAVPQELADTAALNLPHTPAMLALAQAARPGPVAPRACLLGRYLGIK